MQGDFDELVQMFVEHKYKGKYWGITIVAFTNTADILQIAFTHCREVGTFWKSKSVISEPIVIHVNMWEVIQFMWYKLRTIPI